MKSTMKKYVTYAGAGFILISAVLLTLFYTGTIWRSPKFYEVKEMVSFNVPIMDMAAYDTLGHHSRPYIYKIESSGGGSVYVLGIGHTKNPEDSQIDSIRLTWEKYQPDVALVEGRLGFLFSGIQNPVKTYGENGETVRLAKKDNIPFYTWEPDKQDEIKYLMRHFSPDKLALFYSLRPYFSNFRFGKPENPNQKMNEYIKSRTDYDFIRNELSDFKEVDSIWDADFPNEKDWRETSDEYGWPKGYLSELANLSNITRDLHLCSAILELVKNKKNVFVTMGASHAFRVEETLRHELEKNN